MANIIINNIKTNQHKQCSQRVEVVDLDVSGINIETSIQSTSCFTAQTHDHNWTKHCTISQIPAIGTGRLTCDIQQIWTQEYHETNPLNGQKGIKTCNLLIKGQHLLHVPLSHAQDWKLALAYPSKQVQMLGRLSGDCRSYITCLVWWVWSTWTVSLLSSNHKHVHVFLMVL